MYALRGTVIVTRILSISTRDWGTAHRALEAAGTLSGLRVIGHYALPVIMAQGLSKLAINSFREQATYRAETNRR